MKTSASKVFNFVRGAIRGLNGWEDFSNVNFLMVGTGGIGKELAVWLASAPDASVFFTNDGRHGLREYQEMLEACPEVRYVEQEDCIHVVIDNLKEEVRIGPKRFSFSDLLEDSYTQGIHEFYL